MRCDECHLTTIVTNTPRIAVLVYDILKCGYCDSDICAMPKTLITVELRINMRCANWEQCFKRGALKNVKLYEGPVLRGLNV